MRPERFVEAADRKVGHPDRWFVLELVDEGDRFWYEVVTEVPGPDTATRIRRALERVEEGGE